MKNRTKFLKKCTKIEMRTRKNSFGGVRFYFTLKIQKVVVIFVINADKL